MGREFKRVLLEALVIAAIGLGFALSANLVSPRGLSLTRNYFPGNPATQGEIERGGKSEIDVAPATNEAGRSTREMAAGRLKAKGLQPIDSGEALQLFRDPQHELESIVFVDARDDRHYAEGHIPGAYQFDRYYPEKHLPTVLPACLSATKIVVYCTGGSCEDSEFAALTLKEAGVPPDRIVVYTGGMTDWAANKYPIEIGERNSGSLPAAHP
jgi:rhodanese-related sulfurtransferase